jgi:PAS domain S-box-containing protein
MEGLEAGADDFLVKPFSARELVARVNSALRLARIRDEATYALVQSEARLAFALRAGRLGYWERDFKTDTLISSDIYKANWGRTPDEPLSYETLVASVHPDDREQRRQAIDEAIATKGALDMEYRAIWPDGSVHWLQVRGHAVYDENGQPLRMVGISLDITDRKRTEESLREETYTLELLNHVGKVLAAELDRERIVQTVVDAATELSGAKFGSFFYNVTADGGESYTLYTVCGVPREAFSKFPMPLDPGVFEPTFRGTGIVRCDDIRMDPRYGRNDPYFGMPEGHLPVVSYLAVPVVSRSGKLLGGLFFGHDRASIFSEREERIVAGIASQAAIALDNADLFAEAQREIAERRRVETQLRLLLAELNHRVKNTLAIVQSIATQTLRHSDSAEAFRASFEARIMALSEAHNLLTESNWAGASLRDIIRRVLVPYSAGERTHISTTGGDIRVGPKTAVSLVMAFHELATNAAKYGALSNNTGHVSVDWRVIEDSTPRRLTVSWKETGGPPVQQPTRKGFGTRLIRGLSHDTAGDVRMEFSQGGLTCSFDMPLFEEGHDDVQR